MSCQVSGNSYQTANRNSDAIPFNANTSNSLLTTEN